LVVVVVVLAVAVVVVVVVVELVVEWLEQKCCWNYFLNLVKIGSYELLQ